MNFYLGTHQPGWMRRSKVPLFVSYRRLRAYKTIPRASCRWALDSGGFTELSMYGEWQTTEDEYASEVVRYAHGAGNLDWAAPQDWMCEPHILAKTGLSVEEHQRRTIDSVLSLRDRRLPVTVIPVLQGWDHGDYIRHVGMYADAGIDLTTEHTVGIGSVCRRQSTAMAERLVGELAGYGIRLHGFGFKTLGLRRVSQHLRSADSMAWSFTARRQKIRLEGCEHSNCANCFRWAMQWRRKVLTGSVVELECQVCGTQYGSAPGGDGIQCEPCCSLPFFAGTTTRRHFEVR